MSRAVMQQALEALVTCCAEEWRTLNNFGMKQVFDEKKVNAAIVALHAALAEPRPIQECYGDCPTNPQICPNPCNFEGRPKPAQEPVAWMQEMPISGNEERSVRMTTVKMVADEWGNPIPLYTRPYDQTALELCGVCGWRTLIPGDACLNCERVKPEQPVPLNDGRLTQYPDGSIGVGTPAKPEQPVAHLWQHSETGRTRVVMPDQVITADATWFVVGSLYLGTAPTPRKPVVELTDEEIALISGECAASAHRHDDFGFARAIIAAYEKKQGGQHE